MLGLDHKQIFNCKANGCKGHMGSRWLKMAQVSCVAASICWNYVCPGDSRKMKNLERGKD